MRQVILIGFGLLALFMAKARPAGQDLSKPMVYAVPGMEKAVVHSDLVYRRDGETELKMDIYEPRGTTGPDRIPAVIFVHGGPLPPSFQPEPRVWGVFKSYGRLMAASGLVGVVFTHRYAGATSAGLETSFADVEAAIRFVRENAASYHIDPDRVALWVFSGGGLHLSLGLRGDKPFIRCLVSFYGILDPREFKPQPGPAEEALRKYSPLDVLSDPAAVLPPVLIARAGLDSHGINAGVEKFVVKMMQLNRDITLLSHPQGRHGFDILNDDQQSRDTIAAAVAFVRSRLAR